MVGAYWHQAAADLAGGVEEAAESGAGPGEGTRKASVLELVEDVVGVVRGVLEAVEPGEEGGVGRAAPGALHGGGERVEAEEVVGEAVEVVGGGPRGEVAEEIVGAGADPATQAVEKRRHQPARRRDCGGRTRHGNHRGSAGGSRRARQRGPLAGWSEVGGGRAEEPLPRGGGK